ncbi:hypothetical protein [Snodgrassella sp. ESL0253]|uniref:hypothetical protein n=1 Tax=Snodgrassella sp. ESL0253 TaxID=2705031 RepID=UPI001583A16C|nr:hypothetical protein [Snodgrassella sp. ESL0253]NUE67139.1 hypothetical protein [Snodgrassella sp. ESL0253]
MIIGAVKEKADFENFLARLWCIARYVKAITTIFLICLPALFTTLPTAFVFCYQMIDYPPFSAP